MTRITIKGMTEKEIAEAMADYTEADYIAECEAIAYAEENSYEWDRDSEDYDDDYDYCEPVAVGNVYLDEILEGLDEDTNVLIYANSARIIYCGFDVAPIVKQDSLGNHWAHNWVEALNLVHLNHSLDSQFADTAYRVLSVVTGEDNTVSVYLDATYENNSTLHELAYAGNLCSSRW